MAQQKLYRLIGTDGRPYLSVQPGELGGHRRLKGYGRLDCPSALRWIAKGHYVRHRVFFADEATAVAPATGHSPSACPKRIALGRLRRYGASDCLHQDMSMALSGVQHRAVSHLSIGAAAGIDDPRELVSKCVRHLHLMRPRLQQPLAPMPWGQSLQCHSVRGEFPLGCCLKRPSKPWQSRYEVILAQTHGCC